MLVFRLELWFVPGVVGVFKFHFESGLQLWVIDNECSLVFGVDCQLLIYIYICDICYTNQDITARMTQYQKGEQPRKTKNWNSPSALQAPHSSHAGDLYFHWVTICSHIVVQGECWVSHIPILSLQLQPAWFQISLSVP